MENNVNNHPENHNHPQHQHNTSPNPEYQKSWYDRNYKLLLIIPAVLVIFSLIYLVNFYNHNNDLVYKDVSLTGGTTVTVFDKNVNPITLKSALISQFPDIMTRGISDIRTGSQQGVLIETTANSDMIKSALEKYLGYNLTSDNSSIEFSGSTLSSGFYQQLRIALLISFMLMAIVVFLIFRKPIRSLSIILAGLFDIMMTIVVMDMFRVQLSTAGIVALLMLIGYSIDVDILLTTRVFRDREGTLNHRIFSGFKTGITMTLTAMAAAAVSLIFTYSLSPVLAQMFTIILVGLGFDILNCWILNASILKWYMEIKKLS